MSEKCFIDYGDVIKIYQKNLIVVLDFQKRNSFFLMMEWDAGDTSFSFYFIFCASVYLATKWGYCLTSWF